MMSLSWLRPLLRLVPLQLPLLLRLPLPLLLMAVVAQMALSASAWAAEPLRIGSKRFTESYVLAEILAQTARAGDPGAVVEVRQGLGNTAIVHAALKSGAIDVYPEYLGTIEREILGHAATGAPLAQLQAELRPLGLAIGVPLGFNNGYALAMRSAQARELGLTALSQLKGQASLRFGLSNEFLGRADGWPGLSRRYGLPQSPTGLDHGLAYRALADAQIDVTDVYTTDAHSGRCGHRRRQCRAPPRRAPHSPPLRSFRARLPREL